MVQNGRTVYSGTSIPGFPSPLTAPGTSGPLCVAEPSSHGHAVVLFHTIPGAGNLSQLEAVHEAASGRYESVKFLLTYAYLRVLKGSLALVEGDPRFDFLFTDGAGSDFPVVLDRFGEGRLVDVSRQFPALVAADAQRLAQSSHGSWYRTDGVFAFIGVLNAWLADECRLGKGARAWTRAEDEVAHGPYRRWLAQNEPHYLQRLRADLARWGYCST